jgi:hypothetical protein
VHSTHERVGIGIDREHGITFDQFARNFVQPGVPKPRPNATALRRLSGKNSKGQPIQDHWAVSVSGNWRLTFYFEGEHTVLVDYQDYH